MTTKQWVKKFNFSSLECDPINREEILRELDKEFLERLQTAQNDRDKRGFEFTFNIFQNVVTEMRAKFWAISNKKVGKPFTQELFSAFYATSVIPNRKKMFPEEHAKITARREARAAKEKEIAEREEKANTKAKNFIKAMAMIAAISEWKNQKGKSI